MHVAIATLFRDSIGYIDTFFSQVTELHKHVNVRLIACEGDSNDNSWDHLRTAAESAPFTVELLKRDHGGNRYPRDINPMRFQQLAYLANSMLAMIGDEGAYIRVESDLLWDAKTMLALIQHLKTVPAVVPMVWRSGVFYDTWAFRKDGVKFTNHPPYHVCLQENGLIRLDSAGSCMAIRGDIARRLRIPPEDAFVGTCRFIYQLGGSVWLDKEVSVTHP